MIEKLIKNIGRDWSTLDDDELKSYALTGSILAELMGFATAFMFYLTLDLPFSFVIYVIAGSTIVSILSFIICYKRDYFDEKYGLFDDKFKGISYQGVVLFFIPFSIYFSSLIYPTALYQGGIYSAVSFSLAALYPAVFMFLRINVYRNESREILTEDENGNEITEQVTGYNPIYYYAFSSLMSCHLIGFSLMKVIESIVETNLDIPYLIYFICSVIIVSFILSPDIANKILPFELKRSEGLMKFFIIGIILMAIMGFQFVTW